jgi:YbbR domain-containing protein
MGRFKAFWVNDFWIKAFSLVFAIFLWMSIVGGESAEEFFVVPLSISNIPENMIISNDLVDYVNVRVRGKRGILNSLNSKQIGVELDLKDSREGENTITIFPEEIKLPEGVSAVRVSPSQFTLNLSRLAEKWLPVTPVFLGAPASGYKVGEIVSEPTKVVVMGLQEALKDQVQIETRHIELFGKDSSFSVEVDLKPLNANVYIKGTEKVRVNVEILPITGKREFRDLPVKSGSKTDGMTLQPDRVTLVLSGSESGLAQLLPSMIHVVIPEQKGPGTFDVKPVVNLPKGFNVVQINPETVHVKVE